MTRLLEGLKALDRAYSPGHHGKWSAARRAALVDACVIALFEEAAPPRKACLAALGGYGRGELAPASDIDLVVLYEGRGGAAVKDVAERVFYPLWDAGFALGHGVRTVRESVDLAAKRLDAATAMIDARALAGDSDVLSAARERILAKARAEGSAFVKRLSDAAAERHSRFGSVSELLEPDVKEGSGGLRDIHTLRWASASLGGAADFSSLAREGLLGRAEQDALEGAEEYLVRVRSALHLETGKRSDRVVIEMQPATAALLGFEDEPSLPAPDGLMRATFEHARAVEHVGQAVLGRLLAPRTQAKPRTQEFEETPEGLARAFARAASDPAYLTPPLLDRIESVELPEPIEWNDEITSALLEMLRAGERGIKALEAMDRAGLLARYLPEWEAVRCRPQRDPFHRFSVDVHLLRAAANAARLLYSKDHGEPDSDPLAGEAAALVDDRDALLLGALLHDIGKTGVGGHVAIGVRAAKEALRRMSLKESTRDTVLFLVANHLLLADTATRRDLEDENLVLDVAARVGTQERLADLYLLTLADAEATGPHAWTPWRAALVRELVAKVQHVLERGDMGSQAAARLAQRTEAIRSLLAHERAEEVEGFLERMPRSYPLSVIPEQAARHFHLLSAPVGAVEVRTAVDPEDRPGTHALTVVARDRPGLLSRVAGALALSGLSILAAQVFTTEDEVAVDLFHVEPTFEGEVGEDRWRQFRSTLRKALEGRLSLEYRVREKRAYYPMPARSALVPVKVSVDNEASDFFTVIEVGAGDRIGLLFDITRTLTDLQLDVHLAKVATMGGRVVDAFYVRDVLGRKIEDAEHVKEIQRAITARLKE